MKHDKKIGIVGGMGPQATQVIYQKLIEKAQSIHGARQNDDYPYVIIESVPVPDFISNTEKIGDAKDMLIKSIESLSQAGATKLCIASNTVHLLLDDLREATDVEIVSMVGLVAEKCKKMDYKKVGVLASTVTIESGLYTKELEKQKVRVYNEASRDFDDEPIQTLVPSSDETRIVDEIIYSVLAGQKNSSIKKKYVKVLNNLLKRGADGVVLGCTELPLSINYEALGDRIINSIDVLVDEVLAYYYSSETP